MSKMINFQSKWHISGPKDNVIIYSILGIDSMFMVYILFYKV